MCREPLNVQKCSGAFCLCKNVRKCLIMCKIMPADGQFLSRSLPFETALEQRGTRMIVFA